jgi:hypothetical protein
MAAYHHSVPTSEGAVRENRITDVVMWIMFEFSEPHGLESIRSYVDPFCQTFLPWPTKGWPCEIMGLRPFARPSCLLVDPGISVPHNPLRNQAWQGEDKKSPDQCYWVLYQFIYYLDIVMCPCIYLYYYQEPKEQASSPRSGTPGSASG